MLFNNEKVSKCVIQNSGKLKLRQAWIENTLAPCLSLSRSLHHGLDARLCAGAGDDEAAALVGVVRRDGEEGAALFRFDQPLAHVQRQEGRPVQHDVHDRLEGVRGEPLRRGDLTMEGVFVILHRSKRSSQNIVKEDPGRAR